MRQPTEADIKMVAKFYECRDSAKILHGTEYHKEIKWYIEVIKGYAAQNKVDLLKAMMRLCENPRIIESGMATMMFIAAYCELIEPSAPVTELSSFQRLSSKFAQ